MFLLDVNVLIALADADHQQHHAAAVFFQKVLLTGWATCPLTENGFLRIFGHPNYEGGAGTTDQARFILKTFRECPGHQFWPDGLSLCELSKFPVLPASKHLTDYYLLALALEKGGRLASFDRRIDPGLLPGGRSAYSIIDS